MTMGSSIYCRVCGGLLPGHFESAKGTTEPTRGCNCGYNLQQVPNTDMTGWTCPICGRGNAPFTSTCPCIPLPIPDITSGI